MCIYKKLQSNYTLFSFIIIILSDLYYTDGKPLRSTTSLPVGVTALTSDYDISHGNTVSGLVEKFQASAEVTADISDTRSRNDTPTNPMLKRKRQVSRSQIPSSDKHQFETNIEADKTSCFIDDDANDTTIKYVHTILCVHYMYTGPSQSYSLSN